ncbi:homeobox KN domain-containing protein [Obelidium mucronatum]|nr:homeobox KN domain-containing protein [Obelidium mucronatum]
MDPPQSQYILLAALKTLKHELFLTPDSSKQPIQYMQELTSLLDLHAQDLVTSSLLSHQIIQHVETIQAKCLIDQECFQKINMHFKQFSVVATMPGTLFEESTVEKAARVPLYQWLIQHRENPYPTDEDKRELAASTGMSIPQINHWFVNSRRRNVADREDLNMLYGQGQ